MSVSSETITVYVCTTCRPAGDSSEPRPGAEFLERLAAAVQRRNQSGRIVLAAVECLSVCKRPTTIAVSGRDRWTYVYGDMGTSDDIDAVVDGLTLFACAGNGIVPWKLRPDFMKRGIVARIPPSPDASPAPDASLLPPSPEGRSS